MAANVCVIASALNRPRPFNLVRHLFFCYFLVCRLANSAKICSSSGTISWSCSPKLAFYFSSSVSLTVEYSTSFKRFDHFCEESTMARSYRLFRHSLILLEGLSSSYGIFHCVWNISAFAGSINNQDCIFHFLRFIAFVHSYITIVLNILPKTMLTTFTATTSKRLDCVCLAANRTW